VPTAGELVQSGIRDAEVMRDLVAYRLGHATRQRVWIAVLAQVRAPEDRDLASQGRVFGAVRAVD